MSINCASHRIIFAEGAGGVVAEAAGRSADVLGCEIRSVQVGIEGCYKNGLWTPVVVIWSIPQSSELDQSDFILSIKTIDSDGTPITYHINSTTKLQPTKLHSANSANSDNYNLRNEKIFRSLVYVKLGRSTGKITVNLEPNPLSNSDTANLDTANLDKTNLDKKLKSTTKTLSPSDKTINKQPTPQNTTSTNPTDNQTPTPNKTQSSGFLLPIASERPIILIIGNDDIGLQGAIAELTLHESRRPLLVKVNSVVDLPDSWFGYESVDMIILTTTEPQLFDGMTAQTPQIRAIDDWIKMGGRLLFCAGRDSAQLLTAKEKNTEPNDNSNAVLAPFLPGKFEKMTDIRKGDLLESFVSSKRKIQIEFAEDYLRMPLVSGVRGVRRLSDGDMPIVSQHVHGFGTITYFGGDLSGKPLGKWRDRTLLVRKILRWDGDRQNTTQHDNSIIRPAYSDLSGQIRSAVDRFDEVKIVPFSLILIILVVYWLVVGIGDWFIVRKLFRRPVLTWITFPLWILLFCVFAYLLGTYGHPNRVILRELIVVDVNPEQGILRSAIWGNLYSPRDAVYSLSLPKSQNTSSRPTNRTNTANATNRTNTMTTTNSNDSHNDKTMFFSWHGLTGDGLGGMSPKTVSPTVWRNGAIQEKHAAIKDVPIQVRSTKSFFGETFGAIDASFKTIQADLQDDEGVPVGTLAFEGNYTLEDAVLIYGRWIIPVELPESGNKITIDKKTLRQNIQEILLSKIAVDNDALKQIATYNTQAVDLTYIVKVLTVHEQIGGYETVGLFNTFQRSLDMSNIMSTSHAILVGELVDEQDVASGIKTSVPTDRHTRMILRQIIPIKPPITKTILTGSDGLDNTPSTINAPTEKDFQRRK
ncbi:MAG: hypothetical protein LBQ66_07665 [Planctomycetaceae bacterium]|nr:hypothetical protein [Planctomycetaceae bacterium]